MAKRGVSASTQNWALNAIVFLYQQVLGIEWGRFDALRAKRTRYGPGIGVVAGVASDAPTLCALSLFSSGYAALMKYPRSPYHTVGGIVYFGRMIDKIRMNAAGTLPDDLKANLGVHFDTRCCVFLGVEYPELVKRTLDGGDDDALLAWCFREGRRPTGEEIEVWNGFMAKRGWRDEGAATLARRKAESGFSDRDDIRTMFDYIDADEGRTLKKW